jgi:hypothetical protein
MADLPSLVNLAETVSQLAKILSAKLDEASIAQPSFAEDGLVDYPKSPEIAGVRLTLLDAVSDLHRLATGPTDNIFSGALFLNYDATILDILNQFNFWDAVPINGSATYTEIAVKVNLPENLVRRILRYAITIRYFAFAPGSKETIVHTSLSAAPAKNKLLRAWLQHNFEEVRPGTVHIPESFRKYSAGSDEPSQEATQSAFTLANVDRLSEPQTYWDYLTRQEEGKPKDFRSSRFAQAMMAAASASAIKTADLLQIGYDWKAVGEMILVDIGGSGGHDALVLAEAFPNIKNIVVQDLPEVQAAFDKTIPSDLKSRITFEIRDFFTAQKTRGDVYMLKMILHDWPDKYAAKILTPLVPQLEKGARIVLVECVAPADHTEVPWTTLARLTFGADWQMLTAFNSLERSADDWKSLLAKVDDRLEITYISNVSGSMHNFIEIRIVS